MYDILPQSLKKFAENFSSPLYVVGGSVRDFLANSMRAHIDWDLASPADEDEVLLAAEKSGLSPKTVFPRMGTVKLTDGETDFEFTRFRMDTYRNGWHCPAGIVFTDDIAIDAVRRDFRANAVYYDIKKKTFVDPLGGIEDIKNRVLRTVAPAEKVFGEDGLRLMRLARIAAQTGFSPDEECLAGAKQHAALIKDIAKERIFAELSAILCSDEVGERIAPYRGLCLLRDTGVLAHILPELAAGDGMSQRNDFHKYDVLEHTFRCVLYSPTAVRFAALLHDVGKPFCMLRDGNFHAHAVEGERMTRDILKRLKAPVRLIEETAELVSLHMLDLDLQMKESKVRKLFVEHYDAIENLLLLKQADFSACKDDVTPSPTVEKWLHIMENMKKEQVPFTVRELAVNGLELQQSGVPVPETAKILQTLLAECATGTLKNEKDALLSRAKSLL